MSLKRGADSFFTFRFLKLLVTDFKKQKAYKLGIIDKDGNKIKDPETNREKDAYTSFHRLVFNLKKLIRKVPVIGRSSLASFASALWLIKEELDVDDEFIYNIIKKEIYNDLPDNIIPINEDSSFTSIEPGNYKLTKDLYISELDNTIENGTKIKIENTEPVGWVLDFPIFEGKLTDKNMKIHLSKCDVKKESVQTSAVSNFNSRFFGNKKIKRKKL